MGSGRHRYHHGNLREALVEAARTSIRDEGAGSLSLRRLAAALGVSHPAVYRHFADKRALLAEVARDGFERLGAAMTAASSSVASPLDQLRAVGLAYVQFAAGDPAVFRLMFGERLRDREQHPALEHAAREAFAVMLATLARGQDAGLVREGDPQSLGQVAWGLVHGMATLWVDGQLELDEAGRLQLAALANDVLFHGLRPPKS